jgi:HAE1 family hydrophobic/amphiphilic exporter-1
MTALLTASSILFGVLACKALPVNDLPAVDYPVITVSVSYPGASPTTVANNIATPLERQFMQINGLELITSASNQGQCNLTLQFDLSKNIDAAATDVATAITQAAGSLPQDLPSPPTISKTNPNDQPILYIALVSNSCTVGQLYDYANTQFAQRASILPGVSRVAVFGTKSAIRIKADPGALASRGLTVDDLVQGVRNGTSYQGAGQLDGSSRTFLLQPQGQVETAEGYEDVIIGTKNDAPVHLRDVAKAEQTVADERLKMNFWVRDREVPTATVVAAVFRQAGANAVEVSKSVRALLPAVTAELPKSVVVVPIYDRSLTIVHSVEDVTTTLVIAFVLVVAVIFIFLGRVADTLIPVVALPLSLLLTFIVMQILGYSLDNLSLMALTLAIGFLVDDAIVFLENTVRRMEAGQGALEATLASAKEISFTILSMTLSLAAVFIPLVLMPGLIGRIFREFAVTIIVSICASGLVSLTLTPLMCARLLGPRGHGHETLMERVTNRVFGAITRFYATTLRFGLRHGWLSALTWVACMAGTVWLFGVVKTTFLPVGDSGVLFGVMVAQEGSSPAQMRAHQKVVDEILHTDDNILMSFTMVGNASFVGANQGIMFCMLKDADKRPPIGAVAGMLMGKFMGKPGLLGFVQPFPVLQISTGATSQTQGKYAFTISGIDPQETYASSEKLLGKLRTYPGFASVTTDLFNHTPKLELELLRDPAAMYGVSIQAIESTIRNAYSQNYVYLIKNPNDQYQVIVEVRDDERSLPENLDRLYVKAGAGKGLVPLRSVARWKETLGPQAVNHTNQFTSVTFSFNLKPDAPIGEASDFIIAAAKETLPPTIRAEMRGEAKLFRETRAALVILMLLAVFVMYVILGILYESYIHPITVLSSLPVALVGGLATLWLFNSEASLYAFIGMFMLMGIVKKNGIMMIDFALQRLDEGVPSIEAIHEASVARFRPIIMTTLAALMGAVPIALGLGADGESRRPLGLVIVGGLIVSQLLTLYVTPVLYLYLEAFQEKVLDRTSFFRSTRKSAKAHAGLPA